MRMFLCLMVGAVLLLGNSVTDAATLTSDPFSIGLGWTNSAKTPSPWDDHWTAGENTPTTQGDFSFVPATMGRRWGPDGPRFNHRIFQDGTSSAAVCMLDRADAEFFISVAATYDGAAPGDAAATPNYALELEITSLSIYGCTYTPYWDSADGTPTMSWEEATAGHTSTSASINLQLPDFGSPVDPATYRLASNYNQLVWDPGDYSVPLASLNDPVTRTFDILDLGLGDPDRRFVDGLEIEGRVHLTYDLVPEPSSVMIVLSGLLCLVGLVWRRR